MQMGRGEVRVSAARAVAQRIAMRALFLIATQDGLVDGINDPAGHSMRQWLRGNP
jgi:hypothetical protein